MGPQDRDGVHDIDLEDDDEFELEVDDEFDDEFDPEIADEDTILQEWEGDYS